MGFRNEGYAKVWSTEKISDGVTKVRISTSRKNKDTNEYEQDFSGFVRFVGRDVAARALALHEKDRIKLDRVEVTTTYNKEKKTEYVNYTCFGFELVSKDGAQNSSSNPADGGDNEGQISDGELPF